MERFRITDETSLYFVTYTIVEWLPVFTSQTAFKIITESLNYCIDHKALRVNAFVIMPTHFHANVFDADYDAIRLKSTLDDFRKFTGSQLLTFCGQHAPPVFNEVFCEHAGNDRLRRFWQPTQHPEAITSEEFWQQKVEYIHNNPCQKGLVRRPEDWRYSSAAYWLMGKKVDVQLSDIEW
jgi:putative transposase